MNKKTSALKSLLNAARELLPDATNEELSAAGLLQLVSDNELAIERDKRGTVSRGVAATGQ